MRVLVIYAHPVETSFTAALHRTVVGSLAEAGHEVDDCDLYAEGFDPVMTRDERLAYHDTQANRSAVSAHVARLEAAEGLVLAFPVWNFGFPAILKGYLDRVFLPGVSFTLRDGRVRPALHNIRRLAAVTTYGAPRWRAWVMGDPPRRVVKRMMRAVIRPTVPVSYLALYGIDESVEADRRVFMERIAGTMARF